MFTYAEVQSPKRINASKKNKRIKVIILVIKSEHEPEKTVNVSSPTAEEGLCLHVLVMMWKYTKQHV